MAYVKKTDSLYDEIRQKIRFMFQSQKTHAERWDAYGLSIEEIDARIWNSVMPQDLWSKITELHNLMPGSFPVVNRIFVKISPEGVDPKAPVNAHYSVYTLNFPQNRPVPSAWASHYTHDSSILCTDPDIVRITAERKTKMLRVEDATSTFLSQVKEAWEAVSSVNAFVKAWPSGRDLLPATTIQKLNEKVERVKPVLNIDTTALNTEMLKAKIVA